MKKNTAIALGAFILFALILLAIVPPPASMTNPSEEAGVLLGVYEGTTPCADCPGIDTRLTLTKTDATTAEGTYELSLTYLERDVEPYIQRGLWTTERGTPTDPDATVYALDPDMPEQTQRYLRVDADTIRQIDQEGNEIDPRLPFDLTLVAGGGEPATMEGSVTGVSACLPKKGTGAQTQECASGLRSDDGRSHALDVSGLDQESVTILLSGARVEVAGIIVPVEMLSSDQWATYDIESIVLVESVRAL